MSNKQGYFSLIQYSEIPERNEFVNIGIVLFSNAAPRVLIKFSDSPNRIRRAFGVNLGKHFDLLKESLANRIQSDFSASWNKPLIDKFIGLRSGKVRLSSPKSVLVSEPKFVIEDLFEHLVEASSSKEPVQKVQTKLKRQLSELGVENLLQKPTPISLPQGVELRAQYAYQNGAYNMINAISLRDDPNEAIKAASKQAIEGRWLSELISERRRLIVVGDVEGQHRNFVVAIKEMMENHSVGFYPISDIYPLANDIRKSFAKH